MSSDNVRYVGSLLTSAGVSKSDKLNQILTICAASVDLDAISLDELDAIIQHADELGDFFTDFLKKTGKLSVNEVETEVASPNTHMIVINRSEMFHPVQFMQDHNLKIEEQDERSVMLESVDVSNIHLRSMLQDETIISGEEHLRRLKQHKYVRLDAKVFQTLWENQKVIPVEWRTSNDNPNHIFFDGTVLKNKHGRYVICLYWDIDGKWRWTYCRLDLGGWSANDLSAVLEM